MRQAGLGVSCGSLPHSPWLSSNTRVALCGRNRYPSFLRNRELSFVRYRFPRQLFVLVAHAPIAKDSIPWYQSLSEHVRAAVGTHDLLCLIDANTQIAESRPPHIGPFWVAKSSPQFDFSMTFWSRVGYIFRLPFLSFACL